MFRCAQRKKRWELKKRNKKYKVEGGLGRNEYAREIVQKAIGGRKESQKVVPKSAEERKI